MPDFDAVAAAAVARLVGILLGCPAGIDALLATARGEEEGPGALPPGGATALDLPCGEASPSLEGGLDMELDGPPDGEHPGVDCIKC